METARHDILPDPVWPHPDAATVTAAVIAAELARLREQRWRLGRVQGEVETTSHRLVSQTVAAGWRSPAQRAYEDRLAELARGVQSAWRALDAALGAVDAEIDRVKAAR
jgi:hypothetical protein